METKYNSDLKTRQRYTASYDRELLDKLKKLSKKTMIPVSKLLDTSIQLLLKEYENK